MSTSFGKKGFPFEIESRSDAATVEYLEYERSWTHAQFRADMRRREGYRVLIKKVLGLQHGEPHRWRWDRMMREWAPTSSYNQFVSGRRPPKLSADEPSLFD